MNIKNSLIKLYENFCQDNMIEKKVVKMCADTFNRMIESNFIYLQRIVNIKIYKFFESKYNMRENIFLKEFIMKKVENN